MINYLVEWGHVYLVHFGAFVTLFTVATVHKKGLPKPDELCKLFKSATILAATISIFSSHAHAHYLSHFIVK